MLWILLNEIVFIYIICIFNPRPMIFDILAQIYPCTFVQSLSLCVLRFHYTAIHPRSCSALALLREQSVWAGKENKKSIVKNVLFFIAHFLCKEMPVTKRSSLKEQFHLKQLFRDKQIQKYFVKKFCLSLPIYRVIIFVRTYIYNRPLGVEL